MISDLHDLIIPFLTKKSAGTAKGKETGKDGEEICSMLVVFDSGLGVVGVGVAVCGDKR